MPHSSNSKKTKRVKLAERHNHRCFWCDQVTRDKMGWQNSATVEHIIPVSQGGTNEYWNLVSACHRCNYARGTESADDFAMRARHFEKDTRQVVVAIAMCKRQKQRAIAKARQYENKISRWFAEIFTVSMAAMTI